MDSYSAFILVCFMNILTLQTYDHYACIFVFETGIDLYQDIFYILSLVMWRILEMYKFCSTLFFSVHHHNHCCVEHVHIALQPDVTTFFYLENTLGFFFPLLTCMSFFLSYSSSSSTTITVGPWPVFGSCPSQLLWFENSRVFTVWDWCHSLAGTQYID